MESQFFSAVLKYDKILKLTFWFESRESTSVGRFPLVDCRMCVWRGLYALHLTVLFCFFLFFLFLL